MFIPVSPSPNTVKNLSNVNNSFLLSTSNVLGTELDALHALSLSLQLF